MKTTGFFAAWIAACAVVSSFGICASAAVDFEDGDFSFVKMKTDDGGDESVLSVEDFNGSKQLKVSVTSSSNIPKVYFDIGSMISPDSFDQVKTIEMELTFESKDGVTPPGWAGGTLGAQGGDALTPPWSQSSWECGEYEKPVSQPLTIKKEFLIPSEKLVNGTKGTHMLLMRWGCEVDYNMYIDNIRFLDSSGWEIEPIVSSSEQSPEETSKPKEESAGEVTEETAQQDPDETAEENAGETTEEVTAQTEEQAPDSDNKSDSATTGNIPAVAAGSVVTVSGYFTAMTKRRKKIRKCFAGRDKIS